MKHNMLKRIEIASPCKASWADMEGGERVRHCHSCNKSVFNLSAMPEADAAALLASNVDGRLCVRFYQRADGTVVTGDCGSKAGAYEGHAWRKVPGLAGGALLALAAGAYAADPAPPSSVTMGAPLPPVVLMGEAPVPAAAAAKPPVTPDAHPAAWTGRVKAPTPPPAVEKTQRKN